MIMTPVITMKTMVILMIKQSRTKSQRNRFFETVSPKFSFKRKIEILSKRQKLDGIHSICQNLSYNSRTD